MGIRRRRKKLTSLLSNMDRRIRTVEFKKIVVASRAASEVSDDVEEEVDSNDSVYSPSRPSPWKRIKYAYYYPYNVTGLGADRFELFFDSDNGLTAFDSGTSVERGEYVSISRLSTNPSDGPSVTFGKTFFNPSDTDGSEYYVVRAHGTPDWTLSATNSRSTLQFYMTTGGLTQVYYPLPSVVLGTINHTYLFSNDGQINFPNATYTGPRYQMRTKFAVSAHEASTTTATITFSSDHHFQVDDVIDVNDLPSGYRGVDGIFKVASVPTSTTLTYAFDTALEEAITSASASSGVYVHSVAQKYTRVGSTWFDTENDNQVYFWDGLRYSTSMPSGLTNDNSPPSPPTGLTLTTVGYTRQDGSGASRSKVTATWTAPTTSANGQPLDDLLTYKLRISETGYSDWTQTIDLGNVTEHTVTDFDPEKEYYFSLTALDIFANESTAAQDSIVTGKAALTLTTPSAPIIPTPRLGVVQVEWNGLDSSGAAVPSDLIKYVEVHASTTSGFTASAATLVGKIYSPKEKAYVTDLTYNTTYYFKFIFVDTSGNSTAASAQTSATIKPLVDADLIAAQLNAPLTNWPFANAVVTPGALASGAVSASNMFGPNVVVQSAIAANAIGANQIAAGAVVAGKLSASAVVAGNIAALAVQANNIESNAITADKINAGAVTTAKLDASSVTADKIASGQITADKITSTQVFYFSGNNGTDQVRIGYEAITSYASSIGINFKESGSVVGWVGTWGNNILEMGTTTSTNVALSSTGAFVDGTYSVDLRGSSTGVNIDGLNGIITHNATSHGFYNIPLTTYTLYVNAASNIKTVEVVGLNSTSNALLVTGRVVANGTVLTSSREYKEEIELYNVPWSILDIPIVTFRYNNDKLFNDGSNMERLSEKTIGLIAEDLLELGLSDYVTYGNGDEKIPSGVDYSKIGISLIPIIKSLKQEIDLLKSKGN